MRIGLDIAGVGRLLCASGVALLLVSHAMADCVGEYRETSTGEKAVWDRVSRVFPPLVRAPEEYALKGKEMGVSRKGRCADGEGSPIFIPVHLRFELQGGARRKLAAEIQRIDASMAEAWNEYQPQVASLRQAYGKHVASYPPSPEGRQAMKRIEAEMEALERRQKEETEPLQARRKRLYARLKIGVDAYFNDRASDCKGEPVAIPAAAAACLEHFEDGVRLTALLGAWRKDEDGWIAGFDGGKSSHALQTVAVVVSAFDGANMAGLLDWQAVAALLAGPGE